MITTIEVTKNKNENNLSLLRRFSRRVQDSGLGRAAKNRRFRTRLPSTLTHKNQALKRLVKRKESERLKKLGKIS